MDDLTNLVMRQVREATAQMHASGELERIGLTPTQAAAIGFIIAIAIIAIFSREPSR